jgi:hypothetical protein
VRTKLFNALKTIVKQQILEGISETELQDLEVCSSASSHSLQTCKFKNGSYYLKYGGWGNESNLEQQEFNLQIGVEYLAYQIYKLFGISIPEDIQVVGSEERKRIGLATKKVKGYRFSRSSLGSRNNLTQGMFVDMLLANWDIGNTSNLLATDNGVVRIDPGGSLIFRAQGARKTDQQFNSKVGELRSMYPGKGSSPAAQTYSLDSLQKAVDQFNEVESVDSLIKTVDAAREEVAKTMKENAKIENAEIEEWKSLVNNTIKPMLIKRFETIKNSTDFIEETMKKP